MSALAQVCRDTGVIWCYDAGAGVAELKGGVNWVLGNDTTGDGSISAPYETLLQALLELRTSVGNLYPDKNYEFRLVTDDDEATDYGSPSINSTTGIFGSTAYPINVRGWLKAWGEQGTAGVAGGKWATMTEKPTFGGLQITSGTTTNRHFKWVFKDIHYNNGARKAFYNTAGQKDHAIGSVRVRYYGCLFSGGGDCANTSTTTHGGNADENIGYFACFFNNSSLAPASQGNIKLFGTTNIQGIVNSYFYITTDAYALRVRSDTNYPKYARVVNTIFNVDGPAKWVYLNDLTTTSTNGQCVRNTNRYFLRNGAEYARWSSDGLNDQATLTANGELDDTSSEGDPLLVSDTDPNLQSTSPILDKGGVYTPSYFRIDDINGWGWANYDALGNPWGDSVDANTITLLPSTGSGSAAGPFTHRSIGLIQHPDGFVLPNGEFMWPKGIVPGAYDVDHIVLKVPEDPDAAGTCHTRFLQADDASFTVNPIILDSCPLHVTATDNKIDFKEDGGAELTATLTAGTYNTTTLMAEIKTQMEVAGAGTYTVTYSDVTNKYTIAVSGVVTNVQILFDTGTNNVNAANKHLGFRGDTANATSVTGEDTITRNYWDNTFSYEYSTDYVPDNDPQTSGIWNPVGTGLPSDSGVEGTDGVLCTGPTRYIRCNIGTVHNMEGKYHAGQFWSGNLKSNNEAV